MFNLCCCHGQLAPSCWSLTSLAAKHAKLLATILLPLGISAKLCHQSSVLSYLTNNLSTPNTDFTLCNHSLHILKMILMCFITVKILFIQSEINSEFPLVFIVKGP